MGNILDFLNNIKHKRYGIDVRDSIHDAIQQCYYDGKAGTIDLKARQDLENKATKQEVAVERARIDNIASLKEGSTTGDAELADLKVGDDGVTYPSAGTAVRQRMLVRNVKSSKFTEVPEVVLSMLQSVQKWLDEHPEVTTTVQDASLGVEKLTNEAKLHLVKDYVTPEMFGAIGDGVMDDTIPLTTAYEKALQLQVPLVGIGNYNVTNCVLDNIAQIPIYLYKVTDIELHGNVNFTSSAMVYIYKANSVVCKTMLNAKITVMHANILKLVANKDEFISYCEFNGGRIQTMEIETSESGWINENVFNKIRCNYINMISDNYVNNNNRFYDVSLEDCVIHLKNASNNYFSYRGEGTFEYIEEGVCNNNVIEATQTRSNGNIVNNIFKYQENLGATSIKIYEYLTKLHLVKVLDINIYNQPFTNMNDYTNNIFYTTAWKTLGYIMVENPKNGDIVLLNSEYIGRYSVEAYDVNNNLIDMSENKYFSDTGGIASWDSSNSYYRVADNYVLQRAIQFNNLIDEIHKIKISVIANSNNDTACSGISMYYGSIVPRNIQGFTKCKFCITTKEIPSIVENIPIGLTVINEYTNNLYVFNGSKWLQLNGVFNE